MEKGKGIRAERARRKSFAHLSAGKKKTGFKKKILSFFAAVLVLGAMPGRTALAEETDLELYARGAVLMDADSGRILYGKEEDTVLPMASTTKIMTCILALEAGDLQDEVEASAYAASQPKVHLGMRAGDRFYLEDLLHSLMLESHNDSAVAIAEHIGGSVEGFAAMMNEKAKEIGCTDTHFITPNGLDAVEVVEGVEVRHSTTAKDLAKIMRYCIMLSPKREEFLEITRTPNYAFANRQGDRSFSCTNHNAFLSMMDGALSGKTGFTGGAGYCYVGALRRDGRTFIVALLACGWPNHKTYKWIDTRKLMEYGLEHYTYRNIYREVPLEPVKVTEGQPEGDFLDPYVEVTVEVELKGADGGAPKEAEAGQEEFDFLLCPEDTVKIDVSCEKELEAPVEKGTKVGMLIYRINDEPVREYDLILTRDVSRKDWLYMGRYVLQEYLLAG